MLISHHARTAGSVSWCVWAFVVTLGVGLTPVLNYAQGAGSDLEGSSVTFTADIASIATFLPVLPSTWIDCTDVFDNLRGCAAMGALN